MSDGIMGYVSCAQCVHEAGDRGISVSNYSRLLVGMRDSRTLRVWCDRHDRLVVDYALRDAQLLTCSKCGQPLGPGHAH